MITLSKYHFNKSNIARLNNKQNICESFIVMKDKQRDDAVI